KYLVGPFAREYHFAAVVAGDLRQQEQRRGSGAEQRRLGVPHDVGKDAADIVAGAMHLHVIGLQRADNLPLIVTLVEFSFVERDREGADGPTVHLLHQGHHERRVKSAAEIRTNRYVRAQPQSRGALEQFSKRIGRFVRAKWTRRHRVIRMPMLGDADVSVAPDQRMTWR